MIQYFIIIRLDLFFFLQKYFIIKLFILIKDKRYFYYIININLKKKNFLNKKSLNYSKILIIKISIIFNIFA